MSGCRWAIRRPRCDVEHPLDTGRGARARLSTPGRAPRTAARLGRRGWPPRRLRLAGIELLVAREPVVGKLVPRRARADEGVVLRTDPRIAVERPQPHRDLVPLGPVAAEQGRAALAAERLDLAAARGVHANQLLPREELKLRSRDASLRQAEGP